MRAWLFQDSRQKKKLGAKAPWSVGWYDPEGKKKSKRIGSRSMAEKYCRKVEGQLAAGTYAGPCRAQWDAFRAEYEAKIMASMESGTQRVVLSAFNHFERIVRPKKLSAVKTNIIDGYVTTRRTERGQKRSSTVSPATINRELRTLKAAFHVAHDWGHMPLVPKIRMVKEPKKLASYVTPEDFAKIYRACDVAKLPRGLPYPVVDWWHALLTFAYMTGWRVGEPLALRRQDLDLEAGTAITRHADNKGNRDEVAPLHPVVVEHLLRIRGFDPMVFPWPHHERTLWVQFTKIQRAAGIHLDCDGKHDHTEACHQYGFHDFRRAFATANAESLTGDALQALMRHKSYSTTQRYINIGRQLGNAVDALHVPAVLRKANG